MPELSRQSGGLDIHIEEAVDFTLSAIYKVNGSVIDITGYTASFILRGKSGRESELLSLTHLSGIVITAVLGKVTVSITDTQSVFGNREMEYDLMIQSPAGNDIHLLRGNCTSHYFGK